MGKTEGTKGAAAKPLPEGLRSDPASRAPAITDTTAEFEEYTAPPRTDESGNPIFRPKGLKAAGYEFPPPGGPAPPLTKANLAKGIGVPEVTRTAPPAKAQWPVPPAPGPGGQAPASEARPATVKVDEGELFEEYQRSDLKDRPRTGKGIRSEPPPAPGEPGGPTAKEILAKLPEPELQVFTPKRFSPYQVQSPEEGKATALHAEHEKAALDAAADLAVHRKWLESATMSTPVAGPQKAVIVHGDQQDSEPIPLSDPSPSPLPSTPPETPAMPEPTLPANAALSSAAPTTMANAPVIEAQRPVTAPYVPPARAVTTTSPPAPAAAHAPPAHAPASTPHTSGAPPATRDGAVPRIALVQSDFHYDITTRMAQAAHEKARMLGTTIAHHLHVPGAFDIPLAAALLLERDDVDAVVCVGTIVKGETGHDVLIARECARKLADLAVETRKPVGFGVTGPDMTRDQAWARVGAGANAVESVVKQHRVLAQLQA